MKNRPPIRLIAGDHLIVVLLALLLSATVSQAALVRVATWNMQPDGLERKGWAMAAGPLSRLNPDIIVVQHAASMKLCHQLADALRPQVYDVVICSSFHKQRRGVTNGELAILSKSKAYLTSYKSWHDGEGGFAFAALQLGDMNLGVFSVQFSTNSSASVEFTRQIASLHNKDSQLQAFIVAGYFNSRPADLHLEQIGFEDAFADASESVFTRNAGHVRPVIQATAYEAACDIEFIPPKPSGTASVAASPVEAPSAKPAAGSQTTVGFQKVWWLAGALVGCLALLGVARPRRKTLELQTTPLATPDTVRAGVVANLSAWMKQKVVQRLVSDRAQLMATQQAAAITMLAVDKRLTKIESEIQQRHREYEQRIDDLEQELLTAQEENRELIRAKIALIKAEMEKQASEPHF